MKIENLNMLMETLGVDSPSSFGRAIYRWVDCGPWMDFLVEDGKTYYYSDEGTDEAVTNDNCVGIPIGSIVEGSDAEIAAEVLEFPFTNEELWDLLDDINEQACYEWDIANNEEENDEDCY